MRCAWVLGLVAGLSCAAAAPPAAQKLAADLRGVVQAPVSPRLNWVKDIGGVRHVKVLVIARSPDPELTELRADVLARGGSVYMRYLSVQALSVMLPAHQVLAIAERADVQGVSPNRLTVRTGISMTPSAIETVSGASTVRQRTEANSTYYTGLDGSGIGIAVLDSGVMWKHRLFDDVQGETRVRRAIDFLKVGDATAVGVKDWKPGIDASQSMHPGGSARKHFESRLDNTNALYVDAYGHGTHVAGVAAGRDYNSGGYTEATGVARVPTSTT